MLALDETLAGYGARRIALVTPYLDEIQERIVDNDRSLGLACVAERTRQIRATSRSRS
jgi:maleate isomerase